MCDDGDCFRTFAKVLLIIVNIIFCLAGLLMLALGIVLVVAPEKIISFLTSNINFSDLAGGDGDFFLELIKASGIFMIILGGIVAIIACFGFIGACCDSKCMLVTYAVILIIILLAEVALIIFAAVYPKAFEDLGEQLLNKTLTAYQRDQLLSKNDSLSDRPGPDGKVSAVDTTWNAIQVKFKCCGATGPSDYLSVTTWEKLKCEDDTDPKCPKDSQKVPISCCKSGVDNPTKYTDFENAGACLIDTSSPSTNQDGCTKKVIDGVMQYSKIAIGIAAGIVGLEIILITLAFVMCCCRDGSRSNKYV